MTNAAFSAKIVLLWTLSEGDSASLQGQSLKAQNGTFVVRFRLEGKSGSVRNLNREGTLKTLQREDR